MAAADMIDLFLEDQDDPLEAQLSMSTVDLMHDLCKKALIRCESDMASSLSSGVTTGRRVAEMRRRKAKLDEALEELSSIQAKVRLTKKEVPGGTR